MKTAAGFGIMALLMVANVFIWNSTKLTEYERGFQAGVAASVNLIEAKERECSAERAVVLQICMSSQPRKKL